MRDITCINCEKKGHTFKVCLQPVTSHGIIGFFRNYNDDIEFLLVQRKDTIGYIDFVRGKYELKGGEHGNDVFETLIGEMTINEKYRILTLPFDRLWDDLWVNHDSRSYIRDYNSAKYKFSKLYTKNMISDNMKYSKWNDTEFCIAKGRKNFNETKIDCAIREFKEETGFSEDEFTVLDIEPLEEVFYGSNGVSYRHNYYLAELNTNKIKSIEKDNFVQSGEIKNIELMNYKKTMNSFRSYESSKRNIIHRANKIILSI